jgi:hypothetical protein
MSFYPTQLKCFALKCYLIGFKITCHILRLTIFLAPVSMWTANYKFLPILSTVPQNKVHKLKISETLFCLMFVPHLKIINL